MSSKLIKSTVTAIISGVVAAMLAGCAPQASASGPAETIRIGYFANLTHAPALVAKSKQLFEKYLGSTKIEYTVFSAGPAAIEALKGGALDVAYVGPNPAISGYLSTHGSLLRIVGGATSGGAKFVVKPELIATEGQPTDAEIAALKGKTIADPQLGGTQDVALRSYLTQHAFKVSGLNPDVVISPLANADTLAQFQAGKIDGAWVPEPWATRLILEGQAKVFVDEKDLWAEGKFVTTNIVASQKFLSAHAESVQAVLQANFDAVAYLNDSANEVDAKAAVQTELLSGSGKSLAEAVIDAAWSNLTFTTDPLADTLHQNFLSAVAVGQIKATEADLKGIYDLTTLNAVLSKAGQAAIALPAALTDK